MPQIGSNFDQSNSINISISIKQPRNHTMSSRDVLGQLVSPPQENYNSESSLQARNQQMMMAENGNIAEEDLQPDDVVAQQVNQSSHLNLKKMNQEQLSLASAQMRIVNQINS